jgi:hypothetical protein
MDLSNFNSARKQKLEDKLQNSADLFPADADGAFAPPINSGNFSPLPKLSASTPEKSLHDVSFSPATLENVRAELRLITGSPLRGDADRLRRQMLWRRLDQLIAACRPLRGLVGKP